MSMDEKQFQELIAFRVFSDELSQFRKIVKHAKDSEGFRKYQNISHALRCAMLQLIRSELPNIEPKRGRPKKK